MGELTVFMTLAEDENRAVDRLRRIYTEAEHLQNNLRELREKPYPSAVTFEAIDKLETELKSIYIQQEAACKLLEEARNRMREYLRTVLGLE